MKQKCRKLSLWCFVLALGIFALSYFLYHYTLPGGAITFVWQPQPGKPFVTNMLAMLGVQFLFGSIMSLLVGKIFFPEK